MEQILIKNGRIVDEHHSVGADLLIRDGVVAAIGEHLADTGDAKVIDATGKLVFPGMIDSHVHYSAPCGDGFTADDFTSGSIGAVFGGVTTIIDYAFPRPGMDLLQSLECRRQEAAAGSYVDFTFHAEIMGWYAYRREELGALRDYGVNSLKIYTTYGDDQLSYDKAEILMGAARDADLRVTVHAEDDAVCQRERARLTAAGRTECACHAISRPAEAEITAVEKLLSLAKKTGAKLHIVHVSTGHALQMIARARAEGMPVTCETCPHYLLLTEERYQQADCPLFIMTPPLRTAADNEILWSGVKSGVVDSIVSDHCAFEKAEKLRSTSCFSTLPGIPGTETILPLLYTEGLRRGMDGTDLVRLFSAGPARLFGLYPRKGCLRPGSDGDLFLFDPARQRNLSWKNLHSRSGYCPYEGWTVQGEISLVLRRGEVLMENGRLTASLPKGTFISANSCRK